MRTKSIPDETILDYLHNFIGEHGYPPTYRELMDGVGLHSTSAIRYRIQKLIKSGALVSDAQLSRSIHFPTLDAAPCQD